MIENYKNIVLSKGMLAKEDLIGTRIYLLSDMSQYVNGQNIVVDDGFILQIKYPDPRVQGMTLLKIYDRDAPLNKLLSYNVRPIGRGIILNINSKLKGII